MVSGCWASGQQQNNDHYFLVSQTNFSLRIHLDSKNEHKNNSIMVLVTGIAHQTWVDRLCKMDEKVFERVDPELEPPFDEKSDFVKYREEREEFGEEGFMTDKEHEYHEGLVEEMKLVGFLPMNYNYKRGDHDPFQMMTLLAASRRRWRENECYSPEQNPRFWYSDVLPGYKVVKVKKEDAEEDYEMVGSKRKIEEV